MTDDDLIPEIEGARRIRERLRCSEGKAWRLLQDAYASGDVVRFVTDQPVSPMRLDDRYVGGTHVLLWNDLRAWLNEHHPQPGATYHTGAAGRPSSAHLYLTELERRTQAGQLAATLTEEAQHLSAWLRHTHPRAAPATPKTIANVIRDRYRAARSAHPK